MFLFCFFFRDELLKEESPLLRQTLREGQGQTVSNPEFKNGVYIEYGRNGANLSKTFRRCLPCRSKTDPDPLWVKLEES
ncbi:MAG: hypothetical protein JWR69_791 [Pedosphaera sp.]|nr:hypothetical protein [Pedosphaera sp.]